MDGNRESFKVPAWLMMDQVSTGAFPNVLLQCLHGFHKGRHSRNKSYLELFKLWTHELFYRVTKTENLEEFYIIYEELVKNKEIGTEVNEYLWMFVPHNIMFGTGPNIFINNTEDNME